MSPEELNRKVEFLIEYQAEFAIRQERDHEMLVRGFDKLTRDVADLRHTTTQFQQATAQFQMSTAELIAIHSNRLERQDKFQEAALRQVLHLLNLILDRLPPASNHEAT
jgi:hypothetical protein